MNTRELLNRRELLKGTVAALGAFVLGWIKPESLTAERVIPASIDCSESSGIGTRGQLYIGNDDGSWAYIGPAGPIKVDNLSGRITDGSELMPSDYIVDYRLTTDCETVRWDFELLEAMMNV